MFVAMDMALIRKIRADEIYVDDLVVQNVLARDKNGNVTCSIDGETGEVDITGKINATSGIFKNIKSPNGAFWIKENGDIEFVGKLSTSLNGTRIELNPDTNSIKMYNQNNSVVGEIMFMEEQWNGNVNYLPMVRLRNYHNSENFAETLFRAGSIVINDSSLGSDVYSCLINPSIGLAFSKNGVETKRYANK